MKRVLILGATSAIAQEAARIYASRGDRLAVAGRSRDKVEAVAADLRLRGAAQVDALVADLADPATHEALLADAQARLGGLDTVLLAYGTLGDQKKCEQDWAAAELELRTNFVSAASLLTRVANVLERQRSGCIGVISSVAGDRGRQSNYVYGSAKAGLTAFTSGLRNRLFPSGVSVVTVKPGFVDTPMTAAFKKGPLWARPEQVARGIVRAMDGGRTVVYLPFFWRWIMLIIRSVPEAVFRRLKL